MTGRTCASRGTEIGAEAAHVRAPLLKSGSCPSRIPRRIAWHAYTISGFTQSARQDDDQSNQHTWRVGSTEADMLSGISQEHNARSRGQCFTEFCNSQRLSHLAAPFIGVRAKISAADKLCFSISQFTVWLQRILPTPGRTPRFARVLQPPLCGVGGSGGSP